MAEAPREGAEALEALNGADVGVGYGGEEYNHSSPSDSETDEEADNAHLEALEQGVLENPSDYEAHVRYIQCLRKLGHLEKLRQARKSMSEIFPLSAQMWTEWANDEIAVDNGPEAVSRIEVIYEKGVHEYLSVPLWLDYLHFVEEHDQSVAQCAPAGVSKMRDLYEHAISAAGLHIVEGNKIWNAYREFEEAILLTIDDSDNEEKAKQVQRVRAVFHRQLSVPLTDLKATLLTYKHWEVGQGHIMDTDSDALDGIPASVASAYQKALEMYHARATYEDQLSSSDASDSDRVQCFTAYIKLEESSGNPARVQTLYERAISEFPLSSDLWLGYTSYLDKTIKVPKVSKDAYSRATRNCGWIGALWVQYLLCLERVGASEEELSAVFERSLQCVFSSFNEYLDLFLTRIDGLRRRISLSAASGTVLDYSLIRDTFQRAAAYLSSDAISMVDLLRLHDYWARLEIKLGKDLVAARGVWESLIKKRGSMLETWKSYIDMEVGLGNVNEARSIYKRCYSKRFVGTGSEDICSSWLRFEREFGSLDDFDLALKKVMPRLEELSIYRLQKASKAVVLSTVQEDGTAAKTIPKKRKTSSTLRDKQQSAKRQKDAGPRQQSRADSFQNSGAMNDTGVVISSPTASSKSGDSAMRTEQPVEASASKDDAPTLYTDQCTAFVSNLSLEVNENHLREFFCKVGGVTAIRLLRDKFTGKSRGYAYVDFADDEHLHMAIGKNKEMLFGRNLSIARSDPKQRRGSARGGLAGGHGGRAPSGGNDDSKGKVDDNTTKKSVSHRRGGQIQLTGKNTFALPRSVRPLGWSSNESKPEEGAGGPKSNDDFRKMLMK